MASSFGDSRRECFVLRFACVTRRYCYWFRSQRISKHFSIRQCSFQRRLSPNCPIQCCSVKDEKPKQVVSLRSNVDNRSLLVRSLDVFSNLFPLWIVLGSCVAFVRPAYFTWFKGPHIIWTLALIMLAMGLTLDLHQLVEVTRNPYPIVVGALAQYTVMPLLGYLVSRLFALPRYFAVGVCLVACCPGGTASNLVCYLAEANVALSVLMTSVTTLLSVVLTPCLMLLLAGTLVPIQAKALFMSTLQVVLIPLLSGLSLRLVFPGIITRLHQWLPSLSVVGVVLICGSIVAENSLIIRQTGFHLMLALSVLHLGGFLLGYWVSKWMMSFVDRREDVSVSRAISIEVGMQNSGLGAALAKAHFSNPLTAVPCAISATMHSIYGSLLAGYWRWSNRRERHS
ncbi:hypothetical protein GpartN1_g6544.t1 [Galdieria partita]|uniref:Uncharacterized protein n=1 Tax=Galdieria partita TaxID=83374 RepID=A0A9C7UTD1_9RHOD|nr:hypothetical protein GpartN1_g6544.t1 [Galdieria partita]